MGKPYVCPVCDGNGTRVVKVTSSQHVPAMTEPCPACKGACVLWCPFEPAASVPTVFPAAPTWPVTFGPTTTGDPVPMEHGVTIS